MIDLASLEFLWKTISSANGECEALYKVKGGHIVVGKMLSAAEIAHVRAVGEGHDSGIASDETAVFIPSDILDRYSRGH